MKVLDYYPEISISKNSLQAPLLYLCTSKKAQHLNKKHQCYANAFLFYLCKSQAPGLRLNLCRVLAISKVQPFELLPCFRLPDSKLKVGPWPGIAFSKVRPFELLLECRRCHHNTCRIGAGRLEFIRADLCSELNDYSGLLCQYI